MGLSDYKPSYRIVANREDITATIAKHFVSLSLTDVTGFESDTLEVVLNSDGVSKPPKGAELELWLGYEGSLTRMGLYVVDEIELSGWPELLTLRARGTPFEKSKLGLSQMQTQKTRVWPRDTTLDAMVTKIAKEHGLKPFVSSSLQGVTLPQYEQTAESDVSFLVRVGVSYDGVVKAGGGKLSLYRRGDIQLPTIRIEAVQAQRYTYAETSRDRGGTVVAFYHRARNGKRHQIQVGSGDPVTQLRNWFPTEAAARAAAEAKLNKRKRGSATFSASVPGDPTISAESNIVPVGFHPDVPTQFIATSITHRLSKAGYLTDISSELPIE